MFLVLVDVFAGFQHILLLAKTQPVEHFQSRSPGFGSARHSYHSLSLSFALTLTVSFSLSLTNRLLLLVALGTCLTRNYFGPVALFSELVCARMCVCVCFGPTVSLSLCTE